MEIDGFTLIAEIINFLILIWLLQRFLYRPIVNVMETREQNIANRLQEADAKHEQADEEASKYRSLQRELEEQRDDILAQARHEASERRESLLAQINEETDEMRRSWQLALQQEKQAFLNELQHYVSESAIKIARRVLREMADKRLETQVVRVFVQRLHDLPDDTRSHIVSAFHDRSIHIESAFELSENDRDILEQALNDLADFRVEPAYGVDSNLLCGIRLTTGDYRVSWDFAEYTAQLYDQFEQMIEEELDESVLDETVWEGEVHEETARPNSDQTPD